jgi:hypothetical protein
MTRAQRLVLVRAAHTAIYLVMAAASLLALYAGVTGARGDWLWASLALVGVEAAVFVGCGLRCPFTAIVARLGEGVPDTFFPERITRHTFAVFGPLIVVAVVLLAARWSGILATP